ncbi:MAG: hypothetical protein KGD63_13675 [Candidatus Lokiarchaeota archaeon]|nr:hypothetical protein [Candidatus Lokiarchaeota archaeon]
MIFNLGDVLYTINSYIGIFIIFSLLAIWLIFLYKSSQKRGVVRYLSFSVLIGLIGQLLSVFTGTSRLISFSLIGFAFFLIFVHYETLSKLKPDPYFFGIMVGFQILNLFLIIAQSIGLLDFEIVLQFIRFLTGLGATIALFKALTIISKINKMTDKSDVKIEFFGILFLFISRIIYAIVGLAFIIGLYDVNSGFDWVIITISEELNVIHILFMLIIIIITFIGLFLLLANFIINFNYIFRLPFPIQNIILYNKAGITVYNREVFTPEFKYDENLVSGALTAISSIIRVTLGPNAQLEHIQADKFNFFLRSLPSLGGTLVIIAYGATKVFDFSIEHFINKMPLYLIEKINNQAISSNELQPEIDRLFLNSFPFIVFGESK